MKINQVGEFNLIKDIRRRIHTDRSVFLGIGDDAAVLKTNPNKDTLLTTDMLIEGKHFRLSEASAYQIGRKALAVNISDIAAMGGSPTHAVISVGFPGKLPKKFVDEMYRGMRDLARHFSVNIVGGDTNASDKLVISVALLGECDQSKAVSRSGAKNGDVVFVTGRLGGSYRSKNHLMFTPRVREALFLAKNFKVHAMMDISDGLAGDLRRLSEESGVGVVILEEAIPVSKYAKNIDSAFCDGEDFELLFTLSPKDAARLSLSKTPFAADFFMPIGRIVEKKEGLKLVNLKGRKTPLPGKGFDHFGIKDRRRGV